MKVNINGTITDHPEFCSNLDNGAFKYGYGIYETMLISNGTSSFFDFHMERLFKGIEMLGIRNPGYINSTFLWNEISTTIQANHLDQLVRVRLQVFPRESNIFFNDELSLGYYISCQQETLDNISYNKKGWNICIAEGLQKSIDKLANLKTCNSLMYALASQQAYRKAKNDAIMVNTNGNMIETTIGNIFLVKNGTIFTPPLTEGCIDGVMRRYIMENIINIIEKPLTINELIEADEVFLSNAIKRMKWIATFDQKKYICDVSKQIFHQLFKDNCQIN